jgi:hypothetical protein
MLLADTISSTHSTWRVGFILRITRLKSQRELPILQQIGGLRDRCPPAGHLLDDVADVDAQRLGQALHRDAALDGAADHEVLLDRGQAIDPAVVGVALVVGGDEALRFLMAESPSAIRRTCPSSSSVLAGPWRHR